MTRSAFEVDINRDVRVVEAMADNLKDYVIGSELYGLLPGNLPRLTVGGLLMRFHRLAALNAQLTPAEQETVRAAWARLDEVRAEWAVHYERKIRHEINARLVALGQYLRDLEESPRTTADLFFSSMEKRVIVELLRDEAQARNFWTNDFEGNLLNIDNRIRRATEKDSFRWDPRVEVAYPPDKFWFLYLTPHILKK